MIQLVLNKLKNLDIKVKSIMLKGVKFAFAFCIFSTIILAIYDFYYMSPTLYLTGTILFKTSLMFFVDFIILGFGFDTIKKQMVS